ncbi:hypothetical protein [Aquimarina latercula]|uniref:hypothetical protein n=1 Tax=Aquimarina latercula TaxID=987 RepID=UPI0003F54937|nr:hypothetical protein [Aquimarina latercula]
MLEPSFSYYHINTVDIWDFEYDNFFNPLIEFKNFSAIRVMEELCKKIQSIAILETRPFITFDDYINGDQDSRNYYKSKSDRFINSGSFSNYIRLNYFFSDNNGYQYRVNKEILSNNTDFAYWFSLKLRQYELGLHHIDGFLEHHLKHSFEDYLVYFIDFLMKRVFRQYENIFFSSRVRVTVLEYLESFTKNVETTIEKKENVYLIKSNGKSNKRPRTRENYNSYYLTILQKEATYLEKNSNGLYDAFQKLVSHQFIKADIDLDFDNFKKIFSGRGVTKSKRFIWSGGAIYLKLFVHYMLKTQKIEAMGNENWTTTIKCFLNKNGEEFKTSQLQYANGGTDKKIEILYGIVDLL